MPPKDTRNTKEQQKLANVKATHRPKTEKTDEDFSAEPFAGSSRTSPRTFRERPSPAKAKSDAIFKTPDNPIPIVDFRVETSPKRTTDMPSGGSERSTAASRQKKYRHNRTSLSMTTPRNTDGDTTKPASSASPSRAKAPSTVSRILQPTCRSKTPASGENNCDNASTTDSTTDLNIINSGRIKRTEAERKQYFENELECGSIEAHRALCTRCKKWVRLSSRQTYCVKPWGLHRGKCDQKAPVELTTYKDLGLVASLPFVVPRTENILKALLELDDTAEIIEPEQIKCKTCQQWVPLEKKYSLKCWIVHRSACCNNLSPFDIEKTLERKLFFLCDTQFRTFHDPKTAECAVCNSKVLLNSDVDYGLEEWLAHKKSCCPISLNGPKEPVGPHDSSLSNIQQETQPQIRAASISVPTDSETPACIPEYQSQPAMRPSDSWHGPGHTPTLSTSDSDRTLVPVSSSTPNLPSSSGSMTAALATRLPSSAEITTLTSGSFKRKRDTLEDEVDSSNFQAPYSEDIDMDGQRPTRRPCTESHTLAEEEAPSGLGLFLLPFKAFIKGFKDSLTTPDS